MTKKSLLEALAKSLTDTPDDAAVSLSGPVTIPFTRDGVTIAKATIDATGVLGETFARRGKA